MLVEVGLLAWRVHAFENWRPAGGQAENSLKAKSVAWVARTTFLLTLNSRRDTGSVLGADGLRWCGVSG